MERKIFMKRAQGRGSSGFARVLTVLVLLLAMSTGAWATKTPLNNFWAWDQSTQQNTQSGSTYTFNSDWMGAGTDIYADWSAYDYVWMKYSGLSGQMKFTLMYDEYLRTESWGAVFDEESVTLNSAEATSGFVRIAINKTKTFVNGGGNTGGDHKGDVYAKHVREIRIQNPTSPSSITVEGIWVGTEEDYNGAMSDTYDATKNHMLKVYNSRTTENIWDNVAQYTFATPMVAGKTYTIKMKVHAADITAPCTVRYGFIGEGTDYDTYVYGDNMTILPHTSAVFTDTYQAKVNHGAIELSMGGVIGNVYFDNVSCTLADDESVNMIGNADFETQTYYGWSAPGYTMQTFSHVEDPYTELLETADNSTWLSGNTEPANIRLSRTLQTGGWNTFCSPFSISSTDLTAMGITAKALSSSSFDAGTGLLTLNFADATSIEAGKPYLVKVNATVQDPTFEGVTTVNSTTTTQTTYVDFVPTLGKTQVTGNVNNILFLGANNTLLDPSAENQYIKGFRAYFQLKGESAAAARSFVLDFGDDTLTLNADEPGTVKLAAGTEDADKWTAKAGDATEFTALPLKGVAEGTKVFVKYSGTKHVKSVTAVVKGGAEPAATVVDLSKLTADYEAKDGDVLTGTTTAYKVTIADGAKVTLDGATISGSSYCIKCAGSATILLKDGTTNKLTSSSENYPALWAGDAGTTLTIQGSTGALNVTSGTYCAGIGGGYKNPSKTCGDIVIEGGVINATAGRSAAGIGSDSNSHCGTITISGGTVEATGGEGGAGIGSGRSASCGTITITNTVTKVIATKGSGAPNSIGVGDNGSCGTVTIGGVEGAISTSPYTYPSN